MSAPINKFIRSTPAQSLRSYFEAHQPTLLNAVNWNEPENNISKPIIKAVNELDDEQYEILNKNAERIDEMTDEIGQSALSSVVSEGDFDTYEKLSGAYDRALFVFLRNNRAFARAENIRKSDEYRKGKMWNGFEGPKNITLSNKDEDLKLFKKEIVQYLGICQAPKCCSRFRHCI